jgi:hypothetical protein
MRGALVPTMLEPRCQSRSEISMAGCGLRITASPRSVTTWLAGSLTHRPFIPGADTAPGCPVCRTQQTR